MYSSNSTSVDPGLELNYLGDLRWKVTATTGVGAYVWLTEPAGVVGFFDNNAVFLAKGEERVFAFTVQQVLKYENWVRNVTVRSLWDNVLP